MATVLKIANLSGQYTYKIIMYVKVIVESILLESHNLFISKYTSYST